MDFSINNLDFINYLFNPLIILISIVNIFFCLIVFYLIFKKCGFKEVEILLIFILNIIHFFCSKMNIILAILKLIYGYALLEGGNIPCLFSNISAIISCRIELISVGYLAFMRYTIVCHNIKRSTIFWLILYFTLVIAVFAFFTYPLFLNESNPNPSMLICSALLKPKPETYYFSVISPFVLLFGCCISTASYFLIGIKAFKKLNQMKKDAISTNDDELVDTIRKQKRSLILQLLVVFIVFNVLYMPLYITAVLKVAIGYKRTPFADAMCIYLMEISRMIDPIITINFQPELNHEFKVLLTKSRAKLKGFLANLFRT
jgi:hypothetical protein